jgi:hypothetical protein
MESNQKILYEHFLTTKQLDKAGEILKVYPHFLKTKAPVVEETKSKKVK